MSDSRPRSRIHELMEDEELIGAALRRAVRDALRTHKKLGNPIAIWRDGKVVWIPPEEILADDDSDRPE